MSYTQLLEGITQDMVSILDQESTNGEGWNYYSNGRIVHASVYQNEISGTLRELRDDICVKIKIDENEIHYSCNCNTEEGICVHIVALLYSWVFDNEEFVNMNNIINELEEFDKDSLIDVVERLLLNDPQNIRFLQPENSFEYPDPLDGEE
ncbi:hypothetical protein JW960_03200 [candidate division KSB1 bacterium]|nr:hypothetical protein [candidate division KSB1 bacterium]